MSPNLRRRARNLRRTSASLLNVSDVVVGVVLGVVVGGIVGGCVAGSILIGFGLMAGGILVGGGIGGLLGGCVGAMVIDDDASGGLGGDLSGALGGVLGGVLGSVLGVPVGVVTGSGAGILAGFVASGVSGVVVGGVLGVLGFLKAALDDGEVGPRAAARLLPSTAREDYVDEWHAWLSDLREDGVSWHRRLAEVLSILLIAAPRLAVILRLNRRAVD